MLADIKVYHLIEAFSETLNRALAESKSNLGEDLRKMNQLRILADNFQRIRETVMKLSRKKNGSKKI